jgi:hypothetical protein
MIKAHIDEYKGRTERFIIDYYKFINLYEIWDTEQECVVPLGEIKTESAAIEWCESNNFTWRRGIVDTSR